MLAFLYLLLPEQFLEATFRKVLHALICFCHVLPDPLTVLLQLPLWTAVALVLI